MKPMSTVDLFFLAQQSLFSWALLVVGLGYTVAATLAQPWVRASALGLLVTLAVGTIFELGIALLWRRFLGDFDDTPDFTFSAVTILYSGVAVLLIWPFHSKGKAPPAFDMARAARGLLVGVALALALGLGDALFRQTHSDPYLEFRGFVWFFFAIRGIGGAVVGGLATAALGGCLPRLIHSHQRLPRLRTAAFGSLFMVMALLARFVLNAFAG